MILKMARRTIQMSPEPVKEWARSVLQRRKRSGIRSFVDKLASFTGGARGKRILEVGSDGGGYLIQDIHQRHGAAEVVGINPVLPAREIVPGCRLEQVDAREMPYEDATFDTIVSCSAFEHIHDLAKAVAEMARVLRPGGCLYSQFGPIWSAPYGHHLWLEHRGRTYNYWNTVLPPFCHLLSTEEELTSLCSRLTDKDAGPVIAHYVLHSPEQNQMFFEDYQRVFTECPLDVVVFKGYDDPRGEAIYHSDDMLRTLATVHEKHGPREVYDGVIVLLRK